ncbi:clathrin associated protein complex medium subunit [Spiromyces aspiralis]|uniref:Clathrin associated protein complex medium subunit n=1 Tax=Spiromyces aspiralis TaxID=68401 RepID=A0ACC1HT45_9FUNG|nr:clathrin associated protein complex medium subunit [Spiromyces aspiralis]
MYRLVGLCYSYFGKFNEESVKSNFVLIYELLDEILDFGYPQNMDVDSLKLYVTNEGVRASIAYVQPPQKITMQATGAITWRSPDIYYRKNEAFVDVIESVNLLISANNTVLKSDVQGQIIMRSYLSGMPECKFGLNDKLEFDSSDKADRGDVIQYGSGDEPATYGGGGVVSIADCQFHQCVRLGKFESERMIMFIPPDGEFELMKYRAVENIGTPFKVHPMVTEIGKTRIEYEVHVRAMFPSKLEASNVEIKIPTPLNAGKVHLQAMGKGKAKYEASENAIVWRIQRFRGQTDMVISAVVELTPMTHQKVWSRPPISMNFQVVMFTASGLLVRYLKVFESSNYQSIKWVRYMTKAGTYQIRVSLALQ